MTIRIRIGDRAPFILSYQAANIGVTIDEVYSNFAGASCRASRDRAPVEPDEATHICPADDSDLGQIHRVDACIFPGSAEQPNLIFLGAIDKQVGDRAVVALKSGRKDFDGVPALSLII